MDIIANTINSYYDKLQEEMKSRKYYLKFIEIKEITSEQSNVVRIDLNRRLDTIKKNINNKLSSISTDVVNNRGTKGYYFKEPYEIFVYWLRSIPAINIDVDLCNLHNLTFIYTEENSTEEQSISVDNMFRITQLDGIDGGRWYDNGDPTIDYKKIHDEYKAFYSIRFFNNFHSIFIDLDKDDTIHISFDWRHRDFEKQHVTPETIRFA